MKPFESILVLATVLAATHAQAADHHVSPTGSASGDGTEQNPWDLPTALAHPSAVLPGDTIWLGEGTYAGTFQSGLTGTAALPIIVRAKAGARATLDGGDSGGTAILSVGGAYTWYWGFEITSSHPTRSTQNTGSAPPDIGRGGGVNTAQINGGAVGVKFINLIVHDTAQGYGFWLQAEDAEIYGNLIFYNGWDAPDRGHGHAIYAQNNVGTKTLRDNIMFDQFGYGVHAYGSGNAYLKNFVVEGNISFDNGRLAVMNPGYTNSILVGGESGGAGNSILSGVLVRDNLTYSADSSGFQGSNNVGYSAGCSADVRIENNYFAQGTALSLVSCPVAQITGNTLIGGTNGFDATSHPSNTFLDAKPSGKKVVVRPNAHEPGRAHIAIFNWDGDATVLVDLASVNLKSGDSYSIRDAQNFFGPPVAAGTYDGVGVSVPMTGLAKQLPVGLSAPSHSGPEFGAFVLFSSAGSGTGGTGGSAGSAGSSGATGSGGSATGGSAGASGSSGASAGGSSGAGASAAGGAPGQGGSAGKPASSAASKDDGGCGCRTASGSTGAPLVAAFALLVLARRRRAKG